LRGKNKSLLEDLFVFLVIGVIIYFVYSFFFSSNEEQKIDETNTTVIENKIEQKIQEPTKNEEVVTSKVEERTAEEKIIENRTIAENKIETTAPEPIKKEEFTAQTPKVEEKVVEVQKIAPAPVVENIAPTPVIAPVEKKVEPKVIEKPIAVDPNKELDDKAKIDAFYKNIKERINFNIDKNVDKTQTKSGEFVNIRLTIFKDGRYEQLTLVEGNNQNFELIKSSISQAFPVVIDDSLKANFPRYFRMKIEF